MSPIRDCIYIDFGPPFDDSDADVILCSAPVFTPISAPLGGSRGTSTDFRVHKLFLIKASPVFDRLLSDDSSSSDGSNRPPPGDNDDVAARLGITHDKRDRDDLPVLCLSEDRDTLHRLLTAIYPTDIVYPYTLEAMINTLAAARKYGMSSVLTRFRTYGDHHRVARIVTTKNAFRAYLLAFGEGLKQEALEAARLTLSQPQTIEAYGVSLRQASGPALKALWKHRKVAFQAIEMGIEDCIREVGNLGSWRTTSLDDERCCSRPGTHPQEPFLQFTRKVTSNFALMTYPNFVEAMSPQGGFQCSLCKAPIQLDLWRLFDCLEGHVNSNFTKASPPSSVCRWTTVDDDSTDFSRCIRNYCHS
jgi:BTB/POZ domain